MVLCIRGKIIPEHRNPLNRFLIWAYRPLIAGVMRWKKLTILLALLILAASYYPAAGWAVNSCRPSTRNPAVHARHLAGLSVTKAAEILQTQNRIIKNLPGSRLGVRQGRASRNGDGSGTAGDV